MEPFLTNPEEVVLVERDGLVWAVNKHGELVGLTPAYVKECYNPDVPWTKAKAMTDIGLRPATSAEVDAWFVKLKPPKPPDTGNVAPPKPDPKK